MDKLHGWWKNIATLQRRHSRSCVFRWNCVGQWITTHNMTIFIYSLYVSFFIHIYIHIVPYIYLSIFIHSYPCIIAIELSLFSIFQVSEFLSSSSPGSLAVPGGGKRLREPESFEDVSPKMSMKWVLELLELHDFHGKFIEFLWLWYVLNHFDVLFFFWYCTWIRSNMTWKWEERTGVYDCWWGQF